MYPYSVIQVLTVRSFRAIAQKEIAKERDDDSPSSSEGFLNMGWLGWPAWSSSTQSVCGIEVARISNIFTGWQSVCIVN